MEKGRRMAAGLCAQQVPVTFEDITVYFSQEHWKYLNEGQKKLYREVMKENYETLISLGADHKNINSEVLTRIKQEEELYIWDPRESEEREVTHSYSEKDDLRNSDTERLQWKLSKKTEVEKVLSKSDKEITTSCSEWGEKGKSECGSEKKQNNSIAALALCEHNTSSLSLSGKEQRTEMIAQSCLCDICKIFLSDYVTLKSWQRSDTEGRPSKFTDFGKTFSQIELHVQKKTRIKGSNFMYSECEKGFGRKKEILQHPKTSEESKMCTKTKNGNNVNNLTKLQKNTSEREFSRSGCDKNLNLEENVVRNEKFHAGGRPDSGTEDKSFKKALAEPKKFKLV
ncbi:zinc finger protein 354C [Microcaecilia unicolor]|uniref:Zinc finger protein 354C-like n=1 Tax=Microcaecilia unicolor TaxID=1415580 RepID=A0A6P7X4V0_9AMPH|nr:zinc finger protein 354C-like [Microcaecilia unicolor]